MTVSVEKLLNEHIGLDVSTVGHTTIDRAVRKRMRSCDVSDLKAYAARLETSNEELVALIDEVVIPETWFFRDGVPFEALSEFVKKTWAQAKKSGPLRILSMPCSTGEEAYSIAIVLHEAGLSNEAVCIDAVDISYRSLESARRAVYGQHSFRGTSLAFRDRYFKMQGSSYALIDGIKEMVHFHYANLLDPHTLPSRDGYNVIFCRNLLIYFNRQTQQHAAKILIDLLAENGLLFVGHAEAGQFLESGLEPLPRRGAFAYQKASLSQDSLRTDGLSNKAGAPRRKITDRQRQKAVAKTYKSRAAPALGAVKSVVVAPKPDGLKQVRELADQGQLKEAVDACQSVLIEYGDSAQAHHLMGLLCESLGDELRAEQMFRKAVYLDPNHEEALVHLSLQAERMGNSGDAESYRRRVKRISERGLVAKEEKS